MTPTQIAALFTRSDDSFAFARWGRPIAPVVFGVTDDTLAVIKGAFEAVTTLADHQMAETDPELGSNCMVFFLQNWSELLEVPDMERLVPGIAPLVARLQGADANQYRVFRFDGDGAIRSAIVFLRMDDQLSAVPAQTLALSQVVQTMLLWSDRAFMDQSPLAVAGETTILRPEIGDLIRAAYDPALPNAADDPAHALRLFARLPRPT